MFVYCLCLQLLFHYERTSCDKLSLFEYRVEKSIEICLDNIEYYENSCEIDLKAMYQIVQLSLKERNSKMNDTINNNLVSGRRMSHTLIGPLYESHQMQKCCCREYIMKLYELEVIPKKITKYSIGGLLLPVPMKWSMTRKLPKINDYHVRNM